MRNKSFLPNTEEQRLLQIVQKYHRNEFTLIRMTETMLKKSIIDASRPIRDLLDNNGIFSYSEVEQGLKEFRTTLVITDKVNEMKTSLYRPMTKKGDPRFWIYSFTSIVKPNDLVYFSYIEDKMLAIPLVDRLFNEDQLIESFDLNYDAEIISELSTKLSGIKNKGWIKSVSINRSSDKDVGETLENELGLKINNLVSADYKGEIELKCKRKSSKTKDTLFCKVPDWDISRKKSVREILKIYGYPDRKYDNCTSLFITISSKSNNQGFYLQINEEEQQVILCCDRDNDVNIIAAWKYDTLKKSLLTKHKKTMWVVAQEKKVENQHYFLYDEVQLSQNPIFSQFIYLLQQGLVTFDLRSRYDPTGANTKDYGQAFRLDPKNRHLLFGELNTVEI